MERKDSDASAKDGSKVPKKEFKPKHKGPKIDFKAPHVIDPFFASAVQGEEIEKRVVSRDGKVSKLQKNIDREKRYQEEKEKRAEEKWGKAL